MFGNSHLVIKHVCNFSVTNFVNSMKKKFTKLKQYQQIKHQGGRGTCH